MTIKCETCGKEVARNPYRLAHRKHHYCSRKCADIGWSTLYSDNNNHFYGKTHTKKARQTMSATLQKRWKENRETLLKMVREKALPRACEALKGKKRPDLSRMMRNPDFIKKMLKGRLKKPTKPEQKVFSIIKQYKLPFKYVGDGEIMIGRKCPDFVSIDNSKRIVEVYGRIFHSPLFRPFSRPMSKHQTLDGAKEYYEHFGWNLTVIWDDEVNNEQLVLDRLRGAS